ncbi:cupin-like domain-containing protein [Colwellia sp. MSW7]|uniref:Cupin-like domain-containing protein n=1 Tax=Colwellia maritima TaxID=2912588 RepID=A0ABS9WXP8_9GAMM|nr:cupin-like domain-containing protein [Colwellia maritima]MCI2282763.1 cupin-like domain-containing protein [Colwellia maritima]
MRYNNSLHTIKACQFNEIDFNALTELGRPCLIKGAIANSPLVLKGRQSLSLAQEYLQAFYTQKPMLVYQCEAEEKGRFFYNAQFDGMNFTTHFAQLTDFFNDIEQNQQTRSDKAFYIGSARLNDYFPELLKTNLPIDNNNLSGHSAQAGIWLGNKTTAVTHFDTSNNIAACMLGRRRFTLFPPSQSGNLYPGPLEPTPGGQVLSMVDISAPDFKRYPKAREALKHAIVVDLEPGDLLVYPALWWHQVEALDDFNVMINYWWNSTPAYVDDPMTTLLHGMLSLRDRPQSEKDAWQALFQYYIFEDKQQARQHLPQNTWGALRDLDELSARVLRNKVLKKINR